MRPWSALLATSILRFAADQSCNTLREETQAPSRALPTRGQQMHPLIYSCKLVEIPRNLARFGLKPGDQLDLR